VDFLCGLVEPPDELFAGDGGSVLRLEVVVDLPEVHPAGLDEVHVLIGDGRGEEILALKVDPVVFAVDEHPVHIEEYSSHVCQAIRPRV